MIPEAAVEAAAAATYMDTFGAGWAQEGADYRAYLLQTVRLGLEAAAPHMLAEAWDDAFEKGRDLGEWEVAPLRPEPKYGNPYRSHL